MKKDIHPDYQVAQVSCSCGNKYSIGSTVESIKVDVCSNCHPFYTGKSNLVDTEGRVDKFKAKMEKAKKLQEKTAAKRENASKAKGNKSDNALKDLREIAQES